MKTALCALCFCAVALAQTKSGAAKKKAAPKLDLLAPSTLTATAPDSFQAMLTTTKGDVTIQVTRAWAPQGADRFYNLVLAGFYSDAAFFRVLPGFMAQFGLSARPDVSQAWTQAKIPDDPVMQSNTRGRITFATAGPNTRTTQLFINYADNSRLDGLGFAPFGEVIEGMDVVDKIYSGYGEQPDQSAIRAQGKAYLESAFPMLDKIISASIVPATTSPVPAGKK
jgi:peptidyl-prolyl cis-trans isomerase A (cyclophilin A)